MPNKNHYRIFDNIDKLSKLNVIKEHSNLCLTDLKVGVLQVM